MKTPAETVAAQEGAGVSEGCSWSGRRVGGECASCVLGSGSWSESGSALFSAVKLMVVVVVAVVVAGAVVLVLGLLPGISTNSSFALTLAGGRWRDWCECECARGSW